MTTKDARVAEILGWEFYREEDMIYSVPPAESVTYTTSKKIRAVDFEVGDIIIETGKYPPFISVPTYETDGIVLDWVQGQELSDVFWKKMGQLLAQKHGNSKMAIYNYIEAMQYYKPGMYAQALLEVKDDDN